MPARRIRIAKLIASGPRATGGDVVASFRTMRATAVLSVIALAACQSDATGPGDDPTPTPTAIAVVFAGGTVGAELATTHAKRQVGLMNRASLAADSGMIFVWAADQNPQTTRFWMLNTHFDLSIAFLDAAKRVINIEEMTKETQTLHFATAPFRYAVEAPKGWFAARGVTAGSVATFSLPAGVLIDP